DALPRKIGARGQRIKAGDTAAFAKQDNGIASDAAFAHGNQGFGSFALDQQAEGTAGNAVAGKNRVLKRCESIDVRYAGLANLDRHEDLEKPRRNGAKGRIECPVG